MSKPIKKITISTLAGTSRDINAVFDSGSYHTLIRQDRLPEGANIDFRTTPLIFGTAAQGSKVYIIGSVYLIMSIGEKMIEDAALVSSNMSSDMLIGAKTMQAWDITIKNENGKTEIVIGHDMRDPEITEVD